ncbi:MAG: Ig-like domain-containing protein, partial [Nanoarchaeota archaeon]
MSGTTNSTDASASKAITNYIPNVTTPTLNNSNPYTDDTLLCSNGTFYDADSEDTSTWYYQWYDSNTIISGQTSSTLALTTSGLNRGDTVICETRASDGTANSTFKNSSSVTILDTATTFTSNSTNDTTPKINEAINFSITLTDADTLSHRIFSYDNGTGTFVNDSTVVISGTTLNTNATKTIDRTRGITIQWRWFLNDSANNYYASTTESFIVQDSATTFTSNTTNDTNPLKNEVLQMNITITDNDNISGFIFAWDNGTQTFVNDSFRSTSNNITTLVASVNKTIERTNGTTLTWKYYANDSSGTWNSSSNFTVVVGNTAPSTTTLISPGNNSNHSSTPINLTYNTSTELDADNNTLTFYIFINSTINGTSGTTGNWSFNASDGDYNWSVMVSDRVANSSNSSTFQFILDSTAPTINITSPANASSFSTDTVTFYLNGTDLHQLTNCSLWIEQGDGFLLRRTNTSPEVGKNTSWGVAGLENGYHYFMGQCVDNFNNTRNSSLFNFTVTLG